VPFIHRITKAHGDVVYEGGLSASNDMVTMGLHVGTHVDALGHFAADMKVWNGVAVSEIQDRFKGLSGGYGAESFDSLLWPTVVADIPRAIGVHRLSNVHLVTAAQLESALDMAECVIEEGSALLIRTGWGADWPASPYTDQPGPGIEAIDWAYQQGVRLFGSDTLAFEWTRDPLLPVHRSLLVERGVHILEGLDLEEVTAALVFKFAMVVAPLKIRGGTAAPVRPVALVAHSS
jgi:kynurenine formamidase